MSHSTPDASVLPRIATAPLPNNFVSVPHVHQKQDFSCGAAATLLLMRYWCIDMYETATESDLYEPLRTSRARGTEPEPMVDLFRRCGLQAEYRSGSVHIEELERAVLACEPPI